MPPRWRKPRAWTTDDRLELALLLLEELTDADWQPQPDEALARELHRRLDAHEQNPDAVKTGADVWTRFGLQP